MTASAPPAPDARFERLTRRQREVLELLAKGLTNEEIGSALGIGGATVKTHVATLLDVLEVANRTEAAGLVNAQDHALRADFFERPAVAVLGFDALGFAPEEATTFTRGFVDDLVHRLYRWRWLPVIARSASLTAMAQGSPSDAAKALGARYLIHGNALKDDDRYRVTAFLEDAGDGVCLWSWRFEARGEGLLDVQEQLAEQVVAHVCPQMISAEIWRARRTQARALGTWSLVHRALWHVEQRTRGDNRSAHELVERALANEAELLPALHVKSQALFQDVLNKWTEVPEASLVRVHKLAEDTVRYHPEAAIGHLMRARNALSHADAGAAAHHAGIATAINPSLAEGHAVLGQALATVGRVEEGLAELQRARRLNPRSYVSGLAAAYWAAGHYDEALAAAQEILVERPQYRFARLMAIAASAACGRLDVARQYLRELVADVPDLRVSDVRRVVGRESSEPAERLFKAMRDLGVPD